IDGRPSEEGWKRSESLPGQDEDPEVRGAGNPMDAAGGACAGWATVTAESEFLPGLELCRALYEEAVRPVLDKHFPGLAHSAARIGHGSEVLGFDTVRSTDHDWGPTVQLFVRP